MSELIETIDKKVGEVRTEALDLSFGEIVNLHNSDELIIQPEYQRLFRWSQEQKSKLIESILLELPIPQVFVIENEDGVIELIDGLQRVSTVLQFITPSVLGLDALELTGCELIEELNGLKFSDLPLSLRLSIKRSSVRTVVIKKQSKSLLRYEMFKRLNTGGSLLSAQEIRNCSARMLGESGTKFYSFIVELSNNHSFLRCTDTISQTDLEQKGNEELVLRYFATKNAVDLFRGSVKDWLDNYMEKILLGELDFDYKSEEESFTSLFKILDDSLGSGAFVKYRDDSPIGGLAPAYFEAVTGGCIEIIDRLKEKDYSPEVKQAIIETVQTKEFRDNTGPGANSREKLQNRKNIVKRAVLENL